MTTVDTAQTSWLLFSPNPPADDVVFSHAGGVPFLPSDVFQEVLRNLPLKDLFNVLVTSKMAREHSGYLGPQALSLQKTIHQIREDLRQTPEAEASRLITAEDMTKAMSSLHLDDVTAVEQVGQAIADQLVLLKPPLWEIADPAQACETIRKLFTVMQPWSEHVQERMTEAILFELMRGPLKGPDRLLCLDTLLSYRIPEPAITLKDLHDQVGWSTAGRDQLNQDLLATFLALTDTRSKAGQAIALAGLLTFVDSFGAPEQMGQADEETPSLADRLHARIAAEYGDAGLPPGLTLNLAALTQQAPAYVPAERKAQLFATLVERVKTLYYCGDEHAKETGPTRRAEMLAAVSVATMDCLVEMLFNAHTTFLGGPNHIPMLDLALSVEIPDPDLTFQELLTGFVWDDPARDDDKLTNLTRMLHLCDERRHSFDALCTIAQYLVRSMKSEDEERDRALEGHRVGLFVDLAKAVDNVEGLTAGPKKASLYTVLRSLSDSTTLFPTRQEDVKRALEGLKADPELMKEVGDLEDRQRTIPI